MSKNGSYEKLYIITGAGGILGKEFVKKFSADASAHVVACSRQIDALFAQRNVYAFASEDKDFSIEAKNAGTNRPIDFPISEDWFNPDKPIVVTLVYPIGPFEFDASTPNPDRLKLNQINPDIYGPNVVGLGNYLSASRDLIRRWKIESNLRVVCFDSISHGDNPLFWQSYSLSKQVMRRYLQKTIGQSPTNLSALIVNTSTINTEAENRMRPGATDAEKEGWLKPSAVIDAVVNGLEQLPFKGIREIDLFVPMEEKPDYNSPKWFRRWQEQMGGLSLGA